MPQVTVYVTLKPTLLDAQGRTVESALHQLGFDEVSGVRIGKILSFETPPDVVDTDVIKGRVEQMCAQLLANPVTESYRIEIQGAAE